ncbi:MAG: T9SS type A sorting domain-containing protein [Flavobacteriales bacterium]|nr:T9SS type A sorting domain-containing protein [Flavobacteriales bacterium]
MLEVTNAEAQRLAETEAVLLAPPSGFEFYSPGTYTFEVGVINNGPDIILPTDRYKIRLQLGGWLTFPEWGHILDTIQVGDTFFYTKVLDVLLNGTAEVDFCAEVLLYTDIGYDTLHVERGEMWKNNRYCLRGYHYDNQGTSGIEEHFGLNGKTFFPNPVQSTLKFHNVPLSVELYTQLGERVHTELIRTVDGAYIDISSLPSGTYFIKVDGQVSPLIKD